MDFWWRLKLHSLPLSRLLQSHWTKMLAVSVGVQWVGWAGAAYLQVHTDCGHVTFLSPARDTMDVMF